MLEGVHPVGSRLPNESLLSTELGVSRATLREAVASLQALGILSREQGRGTFVRGQRPLTITTLLEANLSISEMISSMGFEPGTSEVGIARELPPPEGAAVLGSGGDPVIVVRRVRTASGRPVVYSVDYLPQRQGLPERSDRYRGSLYELLGRHYGRPVAGALAQLRPEIASPTVARKLQIAVGDLLLVLYQTHHLDDETTVLYSIDYVRNDVFRIYVRRALRPSTARANATVPGGDGSKGG